MVGLQLLSCPSPYLPDLVGFLFLKCSNLKTNTENQMLNWEAMLIGPIMKESPLHRRKVLTIEPCKK
jgi:hypothetical protein